MTRQKRNNRGQSLLEYVMVASVITVAVVAMSTYVFRSVQSAQQSVQEEFKQNQ